MANTKLITSLLMCIGLCIYAGICHTVIGVNIDDSFTNEQFISKQQAHQDGSVSKMDRHKFEILVPNSGVANYAAQDIFTRGSHTEYLIVNFLKRRFCLGQKVIVEVTTDDTKYFKSIITSTEDRSEVAWTKAALGDTLFQKIMSIRFHSYTSPRQKIIEQQQQQKRCISVEGGKRTTK